MTGNEFATYFWGAIAVAGVACYVVPMVRALARAPMVHLNFSYSARPIGRTLGMLAVLALVLLVCRSVQLWTAYLLLAPIAVGIGLLWGLRRGGPCGER